MLIFLSCQSAVAGAASADGPDKEVWEVVDQRRAAAMNFSRDGDTPLLTGEHDMFSIVNFFLWF